MKELLVACVLLTALNVANRADVADLSLPLPVKAPTTPSGYDWSGFYAGGRVGYAWGTSNWTASTPGAPNVSGSLDLFQPFDAFKDTGSFSQGLQAGYNYMLPNRIVIGAEADVTFPGFPNNAGISIGGASNLTSPTLGAETFSETVLTSGTVRGRIGYAPGSWLFYATGGVAWTYDQLSLTQLANGTTESPFLWRLGWAAGAGFEVPVAPHWTARLEYLFTDYGNSSTTFFAGAQRIDSNFALQELRAGLNYQFGNVALPAPMVAKASAAPDPDIVNFHGQTTFLEQAYPAFRSPYQGPNSLPGGGQGRETWDASLFAGVRLWRGAELWINPEIDQGFGLANTLGVAGFPSGEAYKLGQTFPYARLPRAFIRQTIDLSGESEKVEVRHQSVRWIADGKPAGHYCGQVRRSRYLRHQQICARPPQRFHELGAGRYRHFRLRRRLGYTYGAAAEWYQGNWTVRGGLFDLSIVPNSPDLDPSFRQVQWVGEIERRYDLWGHPGKIAVTGFLTRGRMGSFEDAIALAAVTGGPANIAAVRQYQSRGGVSMNIEQEITPDLGTFIRAGWADGNVEPYEFTDVDLTVAGGLSLTASRGAGLAIQSASPAS